MASTVILTTTSLFLCIRRTSRSVSSLKKVQGNVGPVTSSSVRGLQHRCKKKRTLASRKAHFPASSSQTSYFENFETVPRVRVLSQKRLWSGTQVAATHTRLHTARKFVKLQQTRTHVMFESSKTRRRRKRVIMRWTTGGPRRS